MRCLVAAFAALGSAITVSAAAYGQDVSARGCTPAERGKVCFGIEGSGLHVDHFRVERYRAGTICNYYATVSVVTNRDGRRYYYKASPKHKGCTPGYAYFQKEFPGGTFKDNSTACGTFYQDNGSKHWTACLKIHK